MTAARKKAAETMAQTDVVIEVVDARLPEASSNPMIAELRLAPPAPLPENPQQGRSGRPGSDAGLAGIFTTRQKGVKAVALSCKKASDVAKIPALCLALAPHRGTPIKPLRMMIMGIPNVGKSTLMNALLKRRVAKVGDEPAVTKKPAAAGAQRQHDADRYPGHAVAENRA